MRKKSPLILSAVLVSLLLGSCATLFTKGSQELTVKGVPGTVITDAKKNKALSVVQDNGFTTMKVKKSLSSKHLRATKDGYVPQEYVLGTSIQWPFWMNILFGGIPGMAIDVASGKIMKYKDKFVDLTLTPMAQEEPQEIIVPFLPTAQPTPAANADGKENAVIRWYFDSDPRGARIFTRIISSVPDEVKNTNETYLTTTPLEETRSFAIPGLTYDNSSNITIEIKVSKRGYEDQVKRFNVRQALDQQEISSFFELVPKE